jgi:DNA helicase-2/ATP-dependent DNA helicase PcrA
MYIKYRVHGVKTKFALKHIVIDEAQDFSEFQFFIFKKIINSNSLTILGDLAQGIYYYRGTQNWQKTMNMVFGIDNEPQYLTLKKTYRTTEEIMNVANHVITNVIEKINCSLGEPVMKSGEPVTIKGFDSENDMLNQIKNRITELKDRGMKNIALICKTVPDCQKLAEQLSDQDIVKNAKSIHVGTETADGNRKAKQKESDDLIQLSLFDEPDHKEVITEIENLNLLATTPMDALNFLYQLQEMERCSTTQS